VIDWTSLSPEEFERFIAELLELNKFENLQWYGKGGGDRARDIVATKTESPLPGIRVTKKWVVQCKRYIRSKISKTEINDFLVAAQEHLPNAVLIVVTGTLTSGVRDWLEVVRKEFKFDIHIWEERDIERELNRLGTEISTVPQIVPQKKQPAYFYETNHIRTLYWCSEFDEVGFFVMNGDSGKGDIEQIKEFINFLRHNEVVFENDDDNS